MRIRKPRRDMTRKQAPVKGYEEGWHGRWKRAEDRDWDRRWGLYAIPIAKGWTNRGDAT